MNKDNTSGKTTKHPAYGTISFNRIQGTPHALFGSSVKHGHTITMNLYRAEQTRELNQDWFHGNELIAEAEMSYSQFVEAITNMNVGSGIPCTLKYIQHEGYIELPEFEDKNLQFTQELQTCIQENQEKLQEQFTNIKNILQKKSIGKFDREYILKTLENITKLHTSNLPYLEKQFQTQMETTIKEAKGEIEAFVQNKMHSLMAYAINQSSTAETINIKETPIVELPDHTKKEQCYATTENKIEKPDL